MGAKMNVDNCDIGCMPFTNEEEFANCCHFEGF